MRFTSRQVVAMVACVSAAAVLAPVAVNAATGTLVNLVDPVIASRAARISTAGTITVENRAGVTAGAFRANGTRLGLGWVNLASATAPSRLAITHLTFAARGPVSDTAQEVLIEALVRTSGSLGCTGPGTAGYTRHTLERVLVKNQSTSLELSYNGPPLYLPNGANGQPTCFGFTVVTVPSGSAMDVATVGYKYTV